MKSPQQEPEGVRSRLSETVKRSPLTSRIYSRLTFDKMRTATGNSAAGITEMALRNKYAELLESNWVLVGGASAVLGLYCAARLARFGALGAGGRLGTILGLAIGSAGIMWSGTLGKRYRLRREADRKEVDSGVVKSVDVTKKS